MDKKNLLVYSSGTPGIDNTEFEVVERKGIGHPDTLCDTIAEKVSQAYSQYCLKRSASVSSMRNKNAPPCCLAKIKLKSAVRAVPMCIKPVGDGAMRTRTDLFMDTKTNKLEGNLARSINAGEGIHLRGSEK